MVEKADFIKSETPQIKEKQKDPIKNMVDDIRKTLLLEYKGDLTLEQVEALNKGIEYRILSKISRKEFQEYLDRPFKKGGVGINVKSAANLSKKLEMIMLMKFGQ